jgi:DNA-binding transcriptional MerR regulator
MSTYLPIQEAIVRAGVSRSTIDRWRRRDLLDSYRSPGVDRRVYVDIDALLELRRNPPLVLVERPAVRPG